MWNKQKKNFSGVPHAQYEYFKLPAHTARRRSAHCFFFSQLSARTAGVIVVRWAQKPKKKRYTESLKILKFSFEIHSLLLLTYIHKMAVINSH